MSFGDSIVFVVLTTLICSLCFLEVHKTLKLCILAKIQVFFQSPGVVLFTALFKALLFIRTV